MARTYTTETSVGLVMHVETITPTITRSGRTLTLAEVFPAQCADCGAHYRWSLEEQAYCCVASCGNEGLAPVDILCEYNETASMAENGVLLIATYDETEEDAA